MNKVHLVGDIGDRFGHEWSMNVSNYGEIIRLIDCQREGFKKYDVFGIYKQAPLVQLINMSCKNKSKVVSKLFENLSVLVNLNLFFKFFI